MNRIKEYLSKDLNKYRFIALLIFIGIITVLAWQSDDAYHAYIMAKNLVDGNGFVYNIGERATASSCPLFTLVIAGAYFITREMFFTSLAVCIIFSSIAFHIVLKYFCKSTAQIAVALIVLGGSASFVSYTTSGLENSMLFCLTAIFLKIYFENDTFDTKKLFIEALLVSLIAMTRMDAVLMVAPIAVYIYLARRDKVSFIKAVGLGILGLLPFILWEVFATFYFGFPFPNTAYAKLGTNISLMEYIVRGVKYYLNALLCDPVILIVPLMAFAGAVYSRCAKYLVCVSGIVIYALYLLYIGGDFMMGRHFTVMFLIAVICCLAICNSADISSERIRNKEKLCKAAAIIACACVAIAMLLRPITDEFLYGHKYSSPISDERAGYFAYSSMFDNIMSLRTKGELCIRDAWNEEGVRELRGFSFDGGILDNCPGITRYYNQDLYLNDRYALGDPFLSHLPAVHEPNWRIGHMWREVPAGYRETVWVRDGENNIENEDLKQYYEVIKLITRGDLFNRDRIKAIIDMNTGKYDYLIDNYVSTLDENGQSIQ